MSAGIVWEWQPVPAIYKVAERYGCDRVLRYENQHHSAFRDLPGHRHGKLFIGRPCKKRADDLLKLSRTQLKMVVAILTGHAPVRRHINIMGLFERDPTCRFCRGDKP
jgi:hypothetical protein